MLRLAILVLSALWARPAWAAFRKEQAFLSVDMQPAVVAKTLSRVEEEWKARARTFMKCELSEDKEGVVRDCDDTPSDFTKSCSTVVSSVVQGSSGNVAVMQEYMAKVCNQDIMTGWHQTSCVALADSIGSKMSANQYDNRARFQTSAVCDDFWSNFLSEQKALHASELADLREEAKKSMAVAAEEARKSAQRSAKAQKDLEEAEHGDNAREEADLDAERKLVASRASRTAGTVDRGLRAKEAEVDAVEELANQKIEEATRLEAEPLTASIKNAVPTEGKLAIKKAAKAVQPTVATLPKQDSTATKVASPEAKKTVATTASQQTNLHAKKKKKTKPATVATPASQKANLHAKKTKAARVATPASQKTKPAPKMVSCHKGVCTTK